MNASVATFDDLPDDARLPPARAAERISRERAFAAARRHSRLVRFLRRAIPLAIVGWVGMTITMRLVAPIIKTPLPEVQVSTVGIQGSKLTMEQPKLSGFKKDNKAYEMVADTAQQDIKNPAVVELTRPVARIEMQKGSWVRLSAGKGIYNSSAEKLDVVGNVTVKSDNGLDMRMQEAQVDFRTGAVVSEKPVEVDMADGWVKSDRMNVIDNGKTIVFDGRVRSEFKLANSGVGTEEKPPQ